jgi:glyoxylase-like metal-dependent hydrolase (beta-lactamase superfamily II)
VRRAGFFPSDISHIVLTHHHPDHASNAAEIQEATGAELWVHELDAPVVAGEEDPPVGSSVNLAGRFLATYPWTAEWAVRYPPPRVDHRLSEGDALPMLGSTEVLHTPGHTPGSMSLVNREEGWALIGDAVSHMLGAFWLPTLCFSEGLDSIFESMDRIAATGVERIYFGHGPAVTRNACARLTRFRELRAWMRLR